MADSLGIDRVLVDLAATARREWPKIELEPMVFARHMARHLPPGAPAEQAVAALRLPDLYLACACVARHPEALEQLERILRDEIGTAVKRVDPSAAFADDIRQLLWEKLLMAGEEPKLLGYSGRGPLSSWIRAIALRTALDLRRGAKEPASAESMDTLAAAGDDPELEVLRARDGAAVKQAFEDAFRLLTSRERNLLRMHLFDGLSHAQIGAHYGAHRATVARWLDAARHRLFDETRRALAERLRLGQADFESLMGHLQSRLDLSISALLVRSRE